MSAAEVGSDHSWGARSAWTPYDGDSDLLVARNPASLIPVIKVSIRRNNEPVSFAVLEHRVGAPRLFLWRSLEFDAALFQFLVRLINVVARVRHVHERADPFFLSLRRKQHQARFRFRNSQFDPALLLIERLIGDNREPELVCVKIERAVLVGYGNADEFDLLDHDALNLMWILDKFASTMRSQLLRQKLLSV